MTTSISFLGRSNVQIDRLKNLNGLMEDLQRQLTTQKKHDTFSGFGFEAGTLQRYRMDKTKLDSYLGNIGTATTRINLMTKTMTQVGETGRQLLDNLRGQIEDGHLDTNTVRTLARQALGLMNDLANLNIDGRYLFAGSSTATAPLSDPNLLDSNIQSELDDWMDGTQTTAQFLASLDAMTTTDLGFDPALSSSGSVTVRISDTLEMDYTSVASTNGMQDVMKALSIAANLDFPGVGDTPTPDEFDQVVSAIIAIAQQGVDAVDRNNAELSNKFAVIKTTQENHQSDVGLFEVLIADAENVDTTEVVSKIQALQTQLTASYQITGLVNQLSLVNFI